MNASYRNRGKPRRYRLASDKRLFLDVLVVAVPALALLGWFVFTSNESAGSKFIIAGLVLLWILVAAQRVRAHFIYHLRTISTLVEAIRQEDFSLRSSRYREPGALGELYSQINELSGHLQYTEQQEQELRGLLGKIIAQIDVAIVAIDYRGAICLANPRATQLAAQSADTLLGQAFTESVFGEFSFSDEPVLVEREFPGAIGRWQVAWQEYRQEAKPGKLLFITDLRQLLNRQEVKAWQGLIRVIAHEINNSLTPITSISQTLAARVSRGDVQQADTDFMQGLELVGQRANDLTGFIGEYARLARLPEPQMRNVELPTLLHDVAGLFPGRVSIELDEDWRGTVSADPVQLEQLLINLLKNAIEASANDDSVELRLSRLDGRAQVSVLDNGCGIANPANLFIPFYTTKAKGSGIGLALCRQIAESRGAQPTVENRQEHAGVAASLLLPLPEPRKD